MGVAGSGKTVVGTLLAYRLSCDFSDADEFHSPENRAKMGSGTPLTDQDRYPWLQSLHQKIGEWLGAGRTHVLACSALKNSYRTILAGNNSQVQFVYLKVTQELGAKRLASRSGHFMKVDMLTSQFAALEEPTEREALIIDARQPVESVVAAIVDDLRLGCEKIS